LPILAYTIEATLDSTDCCWSDLTTGLPGLIGRVEDGTLVLPGQPVSLRVVALNALGTGEPSERIVLIPAALPSASPEIRVSYGLDGSLTLDWDVPLDTGGGDQTSIPAEDLYYMLEVDEGFYEAANSEDNFHPLTSIEGAEQHTVTMFTHSDLIVGHVYTYRVKAANLMGYGAYSDEYSFVPRMVPGEPKLPPRNVKASTTRTTVHIEYDPVLENGGAEITAYTVYIDDGLDSDVFTPYASALSLTFNSNALPDGTALTTGRIYRLKYSASNVAGEGPLSPEVSILLAEKPGSPVALRRISL
jgi:hypothetical protein